MTTNSTARALLFALLLPLSMTAVASVTTYSDRTTFENLGSISFDYGFEDVVTESGLWFEPDNWSINGVVYTSAHNMVVGPDSGYGVSSKSISSNDWGGPVSGDISNIGFDMFGFDLSMLLGTSPVSITVDTNNASYSFNNQSALLAQGSTFFFGFSTNGAGEYFKSFSIASASNAFPAIDNVTLGHVAAVPEPSSISLLILGLALLWSAARFRSNGI